MESVLLKRPGVNGSLVIAGTTKTEHLWWSRRQMFRKLGAKHTSQQTSKNGSFRSHVICREPLQTHSSGVPYLLPYGMTLNGISHQQKMDGQQLSLQINMKYCTANTFVVIDRKLVHHLNYSKKEKGKKKDEKLHF